MPTDRGSVEGQLEPASHRFPSESTGPAHGAVPVRLADSLSVAAIASVGSGPGPTLDVCCDSHRSATGDTVGEAAVGRHGEDTVVLAITLTETEDRPGDERGLHECNAVDGGTPFVDCGPRGGHRPNRRVRVW